MKLKYLAFAAVVAFSTPVLSATVDLETRSGSTTSPIPQLTLGDTTSSLLNLANGTYILGIAYSGTAGVVSSQIWKYSNTGSIVDLVAWITADATWNTGPTTFTISNAADSFYVWSTGAYAAGGTASYTSTISQTVSVPGPEAGAGLGALAMGGVAYLAHRRRKSAVAA